MATSRSQRVRPAVVLGVSFLFALAFSASEADVVLDGTMGPAGPLVGPDFEIPHTVGTTVGSNLFHSFSQFNLTDAQSAVFTGPVDGLGNPLPAYSNILGRITSGTFSSIDGFVESAVPGANLFLINPNGIVFGPNARLNVDGSFHATTADYVNLGDDGIFYANPAEASVLTTSSPSAFGFLSGDPNTKFIDVEGRLLVPEDQTLSLVGGPLTVSDSFMLAPAGRVNLISVASAGEAKVNGAIDVASFSQLGDINIVDGSIVDGKEVFIRGGQLVIDNALVFPGAFSLFGLAPPPDGGEVNVQVTNAVNISGSDLVPLTEDTPGIQTFAGSSEEIVAGDVPSIKITAGSVSVSGLAVIQSLRLGPENPLGPGNPPNITINADTVAVSDGASIAIINRFAGPGGALTVNASDVTLSGEGAPGFTGLAAQGQFHPGFANVDLETLPEPFDPALTFADSGSITVNSTNLTVQAAQISTDSFAFGSSGDIDIHTHNLTLSDAGFVRAQSVIGGSAGSAKVSATGAVNISDGSEISASTAGSGAGGTVEVTADKSIVVSGDNSRIFSATAQPPADVADDFASVFGVDYAFLVELAAEIYDIPEPSLFDVLRMLRDEFGFIDIPDSMLMAGNAGTVSLATPVLTVSNNAVVSSSTGWDGNGGEILGNVGSLTVASGAEIRSRSGLVVPGVGELVGTGNAGSIGFTATGSISISDGSISTTTLGEGNGGAINLTAGNTVSILGGGSVTADSFGTGLTGNIALTAGNDISLSNGTISTRAETSDGGNIKLTAPNIVQLTGSQITTSVESGAGGGGNINIDPQFIILNNSQITANAFGGPGGNISLTANNFVPSADSVVQASSALSTQGTIVIESPENDIAGSISQLPQSIVDVSGLLPERCAARGAGGAQSSFVVAGRGGLPTNPDNYLPSFSAGSGPVKSGGTTKSGMSPSELGYSNQTTVAMAGWGCPR